MSVFLHRFQFVGKSVPGIVVDECLVLFVYFVQSVSFADEPYLVVMVFYHAQYFLVVSVLVTVSVVGMSVPAAQAVTCCSPYLSLAVLQQLHGKLRVLAENTGSLLFSRLLV